MGSAFHQLCPRYSGTLTPTAPTAIRLWDTSTFFNLDIHEPVHLSIVLIMDTINSNRVY